MLSNIAASSFNNLDGLSVINADELFVGGSQVDIENIVPYTGADKTIDLGSQVITTTHTASAPSELVNKALLDYDLANLAVLVDGSFLNKNTNTAQTVAGPVTFNQSVVFKNTEGNSFQVQANEDDELEILSLANAPNKVVIDKTGKIYSSALGASKALVSDANSNIVSSGVDASKIDYLNNVSSDIQTQLNAKVNKAGDTMTGTLDLGANKITTTYVPVIGPDLINKTYGDATYATSSALANYLPLAGGTMSGDINMLGNLITFKGSGIDVTMGAESANSFKFEALNAGTYRTFEHWFDQMYLVGNNIPYAQRAANPSKAQVVIQDNANSERLLLGNYYTSGVGAGCFIQSSDYYPDPSDYKDHGNDLLLNPLGGNVITGSKVGIKDTAPTAPLTVGGSITIKNGDNVFEPGCIYTDPNWGMLFRGAVNAAIAHMRWDRSDGTTLMKIQNTGVLSFTGGGTNSAVETGNLTRQGALCIGSITTSYGGGWQAGLMMECQDTTEISCHDSGDRLTSFIYYGGNRLYLGRDIGWGVTPISLRGRVAINGEGDTTAQLCITNPNGSISHFGYSNNWNYLRGDRLQIDSLTAISAGNSSQVTFGPNSSWGAYLVVGATTNQVTPNQAQVISTNGNLHIDAGNGKDIFFGQYANLYGLGSNNLRFYGESYFDRWIRIENNDTGIYWQNLGRGISTPENQGNGYGNIATYGGGRNGWAGYGIGSRYCFMSNGGFGGIHDNTYSWLFSWEGDGGRICYGGGGSCLFSQNYDRFQVFRNGVNSSGGYFYVNQGGGYGMSSDERLKEDISAIPVEKSIKFLHGIVPSSFHIKDQTSCKRTKADGTEEEFIPEMCNCPEDGFIAQNILESAVRAGVQKSVISHWYDYEEEMKKPVEEQRLTSENTLGVNDRPIISHTVNVVKALLSRVETLEAREKIWEQDAKQKEQEFAEYKKITEARFEKLTNLLISLST
jgi:hypothetical protein